jgi:Adenylate and Guanylate cyclase catalytic domain
MVAPSRAGDERFRRWSGKLVRAGASPGAAQRFMRALLEVDVRPALPLIQAPTLVMHRRDAQHIPVEHGRYLAEHIPKASLVELAGADPTLIWETPQLALDHVEAFLTGVHRIPAPTRILATVLFTDIVGSTEQASRLGDRRWRELLNVHDEVARRLVEEFGGQLIKTTGDGMLATFDGPGRAIRCAAALSDELPASASNSGRGCTPARLSSATATSAASPSTSRRGCWRLPNPATSWPPGPSATWSWAPTSPCATMAPSH